MTDDDLDAALFALPLATPPAGLRARILASVLEIDREAAPAPSRTLVLSAVDMAGIGLILAIATWLIVSGSSRTLLDAALPTVASFASAGGETTVLVWVSVGAAIAALATFAARFDRPMRHS